MLNLGHQYFARLNFFLIFFTGGYGSKVQEGSAYKVQEGVIYKVQWLFFRQFFQEGVAYKVQPENFFFFFNLTNFLFVF